MTTKKKTKDTKDKVNPYAPCYNPIFFSFIEGQNVFKYYNNDVDIKIYSFLYQVLVAEWETRALAIQAGHQGSIPC